MVTDYGPPAGDTLRTPAGQFAVQAVPQRVDDPGDQGLRQALGGPEIARCMVTRGKTAPASLQVSLDADAAGHVTRAAAQSDEPALASCVENALPRLALDCSTDGGPHSASATLQLTTFGPLGPHTH
jgi:hypothetical protein